MGHSYLMEGAYHVKSWKIARRPASRDLRIDVMSVEARKKVSQMCDDIAQEQAFEWLELYISSWKQQHGWLQEAKCAMPWTEEQRKISVPKRKEPSPPPKDQKPNRCGVEFANFTNWGRGDTSSDFPAPLRDYCFSAPSSPLPKRATPLSSSPPAKPSTPTVSSVESMAWDTMNASTFTTTYTPFTLPSSPTSPWSAYHDLKSPEFPRLRGTDMPAYNPVADWTLQWRVLTNARILSPPF